METAHLALYRKWRPQRLGDVFGQAHITRALAAQVASGRLSHAYLFTGTRGTGKTSCAKILARAVNCLDPREGEPCNRCEACRAALAESALDITELDAASMSGVDHIREIREEAFFAPTVLRRRVYIIDEVHMLSAGAFNALLKTLEEPPGHALFILATTEIHKVPATILSRCQRYDFRRIPAEIIAGRLGHIAQAEGAELDPLAADLLAAMGDGSMRDALSLLDRCLGAGGPITRETVEAALGLAGDRQLEALMAAVAAGDAAAAVTLFAQSYLAGQDMISLFDALLSLLRDIYVLSATGRADLLLGGGRDMAALGRFAQACPPPLLEFFIGCVGDLLRRLTRTAIRRTDGEMCLLRMCLRLAPGAEGFILSAGASLPAAAPAAAAKPAPAAPATPAAPAPGPSDLPWEPDAPAPPPAAPAVRPAEAPASASPPAASAEAGGAQALLQSLAAAVSGQVNSAVRAYLSLARAWEVAGALHICVAEEALIFMDKPAVLAILNTGAQGLGLSGVTVGAEPPQGAGGGAAELLSRARSLGLKVKKSDDL